MAASLSLCAEGAARAKSAQSKPQSYLAEQPAYAGMQFYVYKPDNIPAGWFATYDGYPVFKGRDGVWYYGTREGSAITQTGYVVGSIVPSMAGIKPWTAASTTAPIYSKAKSESKNGAVRSQSSDLPLWARNTSFMALEKWRGSVDRVGVLSKPSVPVAWKGEHPKVIYVWTGDRWAQITGIGETIDDPVAEIRKNLYELTVTVNRTNSAPWGHSDTALLAQYAAHWGYRWMGWIPVMDQFGRPGVPYLY